MKRLVYLLALFVLLSSTSIAGKKRVTIGPKGDIVPYNAMQATALAEPQVSVNLFNNNDKLDYNLPYTDLKEYQFPELLSAEFVRIGINLARDTSDSAFYLKDRNSDTITWTGFYIFPSSMGQYGHVTGAVQFIPGNYFTGTLTIDTIAMLIYPYRQSNIKNNFGVLPIRLPGVQMDSAHLATSRGFMIDFNGDDWEPLATDFITIPKDTIQNAPFEMNGQSWIRRTFLKIEPPITLRTNENVGFLVTQPFTDPTQMDSVVISGVFEWGLSQYDTHGAIMRRNNNNDTIHTAYFFVYTATPDMMSKYPSLVNKPVKQDYNMYFRATIEVSVEKKSDVPAPLTLEQNVPNPVTNTTNISFSLQNIDNVNLGIYDMLGRLIEELVNEPLTPGTYNMPYDASGLPSGTYFYVLRAGSNSITRTMQVVK